MLRFFTTLEKVLMVVFALIIVLTGGYLYDRFKRDHSDLIAAEGGIYTEGVVGRPVFLNPVLITGNQVDRDISQLIFSGLTHYNPHTGLIEDDIATSEKSNDNLSYTFTILPNAVWHDGQPVTADDVIFTYRDVIQNEQFPNGLLKQTFADVTLKKIDERTVEFRLQKPYSFFLANVTLGLLPKHHLEFVPVENLGKSEFNQSPIGSGPYRFSSWSVTNDTHELTLQRHDAFYAALPKLQTVIFRAFPDPASLLVAENTLSGFRLPTGLTPNEVLGQNSRFELFPYTLPQYSALFLNAGSDILSNRKVRFALLLATDKDTIAETVGDVEVVDTPVLESKADLDIEFSLERAMGAFFDTEWNLPSKVKARLEEEEGDGNGGPVDPKLIEDAAELKIVITGVEKSWVTLAVDGVTQRSFLLQEGQKKEYTVSKSLSFSTIGNAAGLDVTVNGLRLKKLGTSGQVLRNLVFDRSTLIDYIVESESSSVDVEPSPAELPVDDEDVVSEDESTVDEEVVVEEEQEESATEPSDEFTPEQEELEKVRINDEGERLILRLVTAQEPETFLQVAELVQQQWLEAGAKVVIETYSMADLQQKIQDRDYDILLFGQNLGYNLDAFPFWHSSQADDGLNLSNYRSLEVDNLLVDIRKTFDERTKQELLDRLKKVIAEDTPAVFLYNPVHYYVVDQNVKNVQLSSLSNHADRFIDVPNWYIREDYQLREGLTFGGILRWMFNF